MEMSQAHPQTVQGIRRRAVLQAGLAASVALSTGPLLHASALWGAEAGSPERFAQVPVDEHLTIDFADDEHTRGILHFVPAQLESHHYAFHVTDEEFDGIFGRV